MFVSLYSQWHDDNPFRNVRAVGNTVRGVGTAYRDAAKPGTAHLISLHRCVDFDVLDNECTDDGDTGITISQQSARGVAAGKVCTDNNSSGINIGSATSKFTEDIEVVNNTCLDKRT